MYFSFSQGTELGNFDCCLELAAGNYTQHEFKIREASEWQTFYLICPCYSVITLEDLSKNKNKKRSDVWNQVNLNVIKM